MQNKANFPKSQMNVNTVMPKEYEKKDTWWSGKNKANSKPNKANSKPIKANKMPKQSQFKAKQTQSCPPQADSKAKTMLLRLTINTRRKSFRYYADEIEAPKAEPVRLRWNRAAKKYRTLHSVFPEMTNFSLFIFGYQLKSRFWTFKLVYEPFLESVNYEK